MTILTQQNINKELVAKNEIINAHEFLLNFFSRFDTAKRGGIHDFMELTLFNMVNHAIKNIDDYLKHGHKSVSGTEIMHTVVGSYQFILDRMKRNFEDMKEVNFK